MKTVCLVGKPNTGKSSLFNLLIHESKSIILDTPGITRDRIYGKSTYNGKTFNVIDTGGLELGNDDFKKDIMVQAKFAIDEADMILFVVDGTEELTSSDYLVRDLLMKSKKEVVVVVNKLDNKNKLEDVYNYYELGFEKVFGISVLHKIGLKPLIEEIIKDIDEEEIKVDERCHISVIGRPNVGKSSLVNALLGKEKAIVSDVPGTTRDAVDTEFKYDGEKYVLIDTAGMRKQGKIYENVEKYSLLRSMKAIERSDVCVLVIDASKGIIEHDKHIAGMAVEAGKALVLCINKWDLIENKEEEAKKWKELIKYEFKFIPYAKIVFVSALTKKKVASLMPEVINAFKHASSYIDTSLLNEVIRDSYAMHEAPSYRGRRLRIYKAYQDLNKPPRIVFEVNNKGLVHFSYERYLENQIRENFDLTGTPIVLKFKNKGELD